MMTIERRPDAQYVVESATDADRDSSADMILTLQESTTCKEVVREEDFGLESMHNSLWVLIV